MKLHQHPDFEAFIVEVSEQTGRSEALLEKDYFITDILRTLASEYELGQIIFKGGTSLSKGWKLIDRLSEDIDLIVVKAEFDPPLGAKRLPKELERMMEVIENGGTVTHVENVEPPNGYARADRFSYPTLYNDPALPSSVRVEPGSRGGIIPAVKMSLNSDLAQGLNEIDTEIDVDDLEPFDMMLLHYRRTFVEKLFAVHGLATKLDSDGTEFGNDARHYVDLYALSQEDEVRRMLTTDEYLEICEDHHVMASRFYKNRHVPRPGGGFGKSLALGPTDELLASIEADYEEQKRNLCYVAYPSFDEVLGALNALGDQL
ncbi:MAG: nucleotidyl transferase AbiEii/AbiGii toxin family protein [Solirubrobacterales bacterium]